MPTLLKKYNADLYFPPGSPGAALKPAQVLQGVGPCVEVELMVSEAYEHHAKANNLPIPAAIKGRALIDTGASTTCVDETAVASLGISPIDKVWMTSASHDRTEKGVYPVRLFTREKSGNITITANRAIGAALAGQGLLALVGRDILKDMVLFYQGKDGHIRLSFAP